MEDALYFMFFSFLIIIYIFINYSDNKKRKEEANKYRLGKMSKKEAAEFEQRLKEQEVQLEKKKEKIRKQELTQKKREGKNTIIKAMIVASNNDSKKKIGSSIIRGTVGASVLGPVGMVTGVATAKNKSKISTTFLIEFEDGHKETKTVNNNSKEFKKLCNYIEI